MEIDLEALNELNPDNLHQNGGRSFGMNSVHSNLTY